MNDFELRNAACIAQKYADDLEAVCRKRGLFEKPFVQWSRLTSLPPDACGGGIVDDATT